MIRILASFCSFVFTGAPFCIYLLCGRGLVIDVNSMTNGWQCLELEFVAQCPLRLCFWGFELKARMPNCYGFGPKTFDFWGQRKRLMSKFLLHRRNHRREGNFFFFVSRDNRQRILTKIRYFSKTIGRTVDVVEFSFWRLRNLSDHQNFRPPKIFFRRVISERNKILGYFWRLVLDFPLFFHYLRHSGPPMA